MISWLPWLAIGFLCGLVIGYRKGYDKGHYRCLSELFDLKISPEDLQLSVAKLEALWLSGTLEKICRTPDCPDCCKAEAWRNDANKWAREKISERLREKVNE